MTKSKTNPVTWFEIYVQDASRAKTFLRDRPAIKA